MTQDPATEHDLQKLVRRHRERVEQARREGERPMGRNLALVGVLGWLIVAPMLGALLLGRWIDHRAGTGIFWTATSVFLGAALGAWMAWQRMQEP
jgi:ATP synthase protein I